MIYNRVCLNELREFELEFEYNSNRMETNLHEKKNNRKPKEKEKTLKTLIQYKSRIVKFKISNFFNN